MGDARRRRPADEEPPDEHRCTCPYCILESLRVLIETGRTGMALAALATMPDAIHGMGQCAFNAGYSAGYADAAAGLPDKTAGPCGDDDDDDDLTPPAWEH